MLKGRLTGKDESGKLLLRMQISGRCKRKEGEGIEEQRTEVQVQVFESVVRDGEEGDTRWK